MGCFLGGSGGPSNPWMCSKRDADCLVVLRDLAGQLLAQEPEKGGARKSRVAVPQEWLEKIRKAWEREANGALERADRGGGSTTTAWPTGGTRRSDPATWSGRPS